MNVKVNCVIMRGVNDYELVDFVEMTRHKNVEVRFIEYMPFDGNRWSHGKFYSYKEMTDTIKVKYPTLERVVVCAATTHIDSVGLHWMIHICNTVINRMVPMRHLKHGMYQDSKDALASLHQ